MELFLVIEQYFFFVFCYGFVMDTFQKHANVIAQFVNRRAMMNHVYQEVDKICGPVPLKDVSWQLLHCLAGGDVVNRYQEDMAYIALTDKWWVPVRDLVNIYTKLYGHTGRVNVTVVEECTTLMFLERWLFLTSDFF